jgi:hypothetical protein
MRLFSGRLGVQLQDVPHIMRLFQLREVVSIDLRDRSAFSQ